MYIRYFTVLSLLILQGALVMGTRADQKKPKLPESRWDLSKSNDVSLVHWPADMKDKDGVACLAGPRKVFLRLANGKTISAIVDEIHAEKRGKRISWIALLYPKMTLKESVIITNEVVSRLDYTSTNIPAWSKKASVGLALNFEEIFRGKKYELTINILHSYDKSHPWSVKATIYFPQAHKDARQKKTRKDCHVGTGLYPNTAVKGDALHKSYKR